MDEVRYRVAEQRLWSSLWCSPTERRLRLERTGATVRVQELGEGPAVLFVHGGSICGTCWAPLVARLEGFRCLLLDRPGCGLSPPLARGFDDVAQLASFADAVLVDVLDGLGLDRAHLVATSFGGWFALRTAAAHPERVDHLMELGFPMGAPPETTPLAMRLVAVPLVGPLLMALPPNERMVRSMLRNIGLGQALDAGRISQEAVDWNLALLRDTDTMRNELELGPRIILPLRGMNEQLRLSDEVLGAISSPSFFLWGAEDPFGGAETARAFVARVPGAALELVPGAGHAVWMDDPEGTAAATTRFLTG